MAESIQQKAFLFMPDISGFTKFIGETEIEHSTHIIRELLEIIIEENRLDMELAEIEGDAVFFYRLNSIPSTADIATQAHQMFIKFHEHLAKYESRRICQCGACKTANNLTLKFIAHSGVVSRYSISSRFKLIGKDVILLHRLLKNSVPENEYLLYTESFFADLASNLSKLKTLSFFEKEEIADGIAVRYNYAPVGHWHSEIVIPLNDGLSEQNELVPAAVIRDEISAPAEIIFTYLADLSKRNQWQAGVKDIQITSGAAINQAGTIHKCILDNNETSVFKTNYFEPRGNLLRFIETDNKRKSFAHQFTVERTSDNCSMIQIEFLIKGDFFSKMFFAIFMRKKVDKSLLKSAANLKALFKKATLVPSLTNRLPIK